MLLDRGLALFFFFGSALYLYSAMDFSFGGLGAPRAGFLPTIVGTAGGTLAGINAVRTFLARETSDYGMDFRKAALFALAMAAYVLLLPIVNFELCTFVLTFVLLTVSGVHGWLKPSLIAAATAGAIYVGFGVLLNVPLP